MQQSPVGILDFVFEEDLKNNDADVVHTVQLKNQHNQLFYDKLSFIYITLPQFKKQLNELQTVQDKWFYFFKHLPNLNDIPKELQENVFLQAFEVAKIAKFTPSEKQGYEDSLKYYRDVNNTMETKLREGLEMGIAIGEQKAMRSMVNTMKNNGMSVELIAKALSLDEAVIVEWLKEG